MVLLLRCTELEVAIAIMSQKTGILKETDWACSFVHCKEGHLNET